VTERSIGGHDGNAADHVVHDVMVGDYADGIGAGFSGDVDGHYHFRAVQFCIGSGDKVGPAHGMEHDFVDVDAREAGEDDDQRDGEHDGELTEHFGFSAPV